MIQITDASFGYDKEHKIISNLNLSIAEGERVGLIGANGAGKSTLLKMLTGLVGHEGSIRICGLEVEKKHLPEIRKSLGFVFQDSDSQLFMPTVYDDIAFAPRNYGMSKEEVEDRVNEALERTGIAYLKYKENYKMSGGEKRMACIATILAMKPKIILMDEPSMGLSPIFVNEIFDIIKEVSKSGTTVLLVEQNAKKALSIADRAYVLETGRIVLEGKAKDLLNDDSIKKAYLGE